MEWTIKAYGWCLILALTLGLFSGCAIKPKPFVPLEKLAPSDYPDVADDLNYDGLKPAIHQSLQWLKRLPDTTMFVFHQDQFSKMHMIRSLRMFLNFINNNPDPSQLAGFLKKNYLIYRAGGDEKTGNVLFTGYYEPILEGRRMPVGNFRYPVYARPKDLITADLSAFSPEYKGIRLVGRVDGNRFVPYFSRKEIEMRQVLKDRALALAWVADRVGLFFLQIQGSGKIRLEDGQMISVHYDGKNGRPYRSIGKLLIESGKIPKEKISMQSIKSYLKAHPDEVNGILNANPSYVFFRIEPEGPIGALSVKLTPGRSLAVDRSIFPMGGLAFIRTQKPQVDADGQIIHWQQFSRFVLNQDTGGAIRGAGRADLFWGNDSYAEIAAGHMQHPGQLFFLVLRPDVVF